MKVFQTRIRPGNLPIVVRRGRDYLGKLFKENGLNRGIEVGVRRGAFSLALCKENPDLEIYCIDPWIRYGGWSQEGQDANKKIAGERLSPYNATLMEMYSMEAIHEFDKKPLDFAYIDGDHRFDHCMQDIIEWSRRDRRGGIVAVHDYSCIPGDVGTSVRAYTHAHHIDPWYLTRDLEGTAFWVKP